MPHVGAGRFTPEGDATARRDAPKAQNVWGRWMGRAAIAAGGLLSASVASALYVANAVTRASKVSPTDLYVFTPYELNVPCDEVRIPVTEDDALAGWWLPRDETDRVILICYGYRNRKSDMLGIGSMLWRHGFNVLIFDYHGHGEHAGTRVTLGYREVDDALAAVHYVFARKPAARLGALGYSMGASVAIMAAARDYRITALIADSPFATQRNAISRRLRQRFRQAWSERPVLFFADYLLHWLVGYRFRDVEPVREITRLGSRPILLIHGMQDSIVDPSDSEALFNAAPGPRELWQVANCEHCGAYFADRRLYVARCVSFFNRALGGDRIRSAAVEQIELEDEEKNHSQNAQQYDEYEHGPRTVVGRRRPV